MIAARARKASLASPAVGNAAATSGSRTTTALPAAYRDAYWFRRALRKSYSGKISSAGICRSTPPLFRVFLIISPLASRRPPSTNDTNCLTAIDEHHCQQAFRRSHSKCSATAHYTRPLDGTRHSRGGAWSGTLGGLLINAPVAGYLPSVRDPELGSGF